MTSSLSRLILIISLLVWLISSGEVTLAGSTDCIADGSLDAVQFLKKCGEGTNAISVSGTGSTTGIDDISAKVTTYAQTGIVLGSLFAIAMIVWAGIQYNTSYGDDTKVKNAKNTAIYALIGLLLLMMSFPLVNIAINFIYGLAK